MKKHFSFFSAAIAAVILLTSCNVSGTPLYETEADGRTYTAYGSDSGITSVSVSENGSVIAAVKVSQKSSDEPYTEGDGKNYGLTVADVDCDGYTDIVIQVSTSGMGKYRFFFGNGESYDEYRPFAEFTGTVFNRGDGLIGNTTDTTTYLIRDTDAPDVYIRERKTVYYSRNSNGKFSQISAESFAYYSETDIYCYSTYIWDENEKALVSDSDKWMTADQLERNGFEPF